MLVSSCKHYREGSTDKTHFPLYLFLAGVGSGKSRHASEFYKSAVECINDEDYELQKRLKDASRSALGGTRILLQLLPDLQLKDLGRRYEAPDPLDVIELLAKRRGCSLPESTIILVIDGVQNIFDNPLFRATVTAIGDLTAQGPFVIPCSTATSSTDIHDAFGLSSRPRMYLPVEPLEPQRINGALIFNPDPLTKILVDDCGGHGRALEILAKTLAKKRLLELYHSAINWSGDEARSLILAVLTHQLLDANLPLPNTNKTLKGTEKTLE
ncbi:putative crinkler family protein [Elaphomyces granulatus]